MRFLTFSFLKNCKLKRFGPYFPKSKYSDAATVKIDPEKIKGDPNLVEISSTWRVDQEPELRAAVMQDMRVLPDFISEQEEASLMAELEPYLKRMRYEYDHWDNAIQGYRETERSEWSAGNAGVLWRVREVALRGAPPLPHVHVLDLAPAGHIAPHIDAVRFCGDVIAGLCLCSSAVMRLQHARAPTCELSALLPRRCLYIMTGVARYEFSHAVAGGAWRGEAVRRARRVSLICRSEPRADRAA